MKTSAKRSQERRHRLRSQGLKEVRNLWVKPEHEQPIREYAAKLEGNKNTANHEEQI